MNSVQAQTKVRTLATASIASQIYVTQPPPGSTLVTKRNQTQATIDGLGSGRTVSTPTVPEGSAHTRKPPNGSTGSGGDSDSKDGDGAVFVQTPVVVGCALGLAVILICACVACVVVRRRTEHPKLSSLTDLDTALTDHENIPTEWNDDAETPDMFSHSRQISGFPGGFPGGTTQHQGFRKITSPFQQEARPQPVRAAFLEPHKRASSSSSITDNWNIGGEEHYSNIEGEDDYSNIGARVYDSIASLAVDSARKPAVESNTPRAVTHHEPTMDFSFQFAGRQEEAAALNVGLKGSQDNAASTDFVELHPHIFTEKQQQERSCVQKSWQRKLRLLPSNESTGSAASVHSIVSDV